MEFDPEDQEIIRLLAKLSDAEGEYPKHMLEARRQSFLSQMGQIGLGIGADQGIQNAIQDIKPAPPAASPAVSTLLESALVIAILAEAGTVAYFYRDQLARFFRKGAIEPRVQEVTPPPAVTTSLEIQGVTPSSALPSTVPSATLFSTPTRSGIAITSTSTPIPGLVEDPQNSTSTGGMNVLNATPAPNSNNTNNGNNGHHYGQTPKPERTKENGNNPPPNENNNRPPNENSNRPPNENNDRAPNENSNRLPNENNDRPPNENNDRPPRE